MNQTKEVPVFGDRAWIAKRDTAAREAWIATVTAPRCPYHPKGMQRAPDDEFYSRVTRTTGVHFWCRHTDPCGSCGGSGAVTHGNVRIDCDRCDGFGIIDCGWSEEVTQ